MPALRCALLTHSWLLDVRVVFMFQNIIIKHATATKILKHLTEFFLQKKTVTQEI